MAGSGAMEGKISPLLIIFFHFVCMSMPPRSEQKLYGLKIRIIQRSLMENFRKKFVVGILSL